MASAHVCDHCGRPQTALRQLETTFGGTTVLLLCAGCKRELDGMIRRFKRVHGVIVTALR